MVKGVSVLILFMLSVFSGCAGNVGTEWGNGNEGEKKSELASGPFINLQFVAKPFEEKVELNLALHRVDTYVQHKVTEEISVHSAALNAWINWSAVADRAGGFLLNSLVPDPHNHKMGYLILILDKISIPSAEYSLVAKFGEGEPKRFIDPIGIILASEDPEGIDLGELASKPEAVLELDLESAPVGKHSFIERLKKGHTDGVGIVRVQGPAVD